MTPLVRQRSVRSRGDHPRPRRRLQGDSGAGLIEFALVLPFLAIFIFGTIDIGRAFALRNRLTNMSREGAFFAQYKPYYGSGCSPSSITSVATIEDPTVTNATVEVTDVAGAPLLNSCTPLAIPVGIQVKVKVSAPMKVYTPFASVATGNSVTVSGETDVVVQG